MRVISKKLTDRLLCELKLSRSAMKSRHASAKKLSALEAERMVRVAWTFKRATEVFEDEEDAGNRLRRSVRALREKRLYPFWTSIRVATWSKTNWSVSNTASHPDLRDKPSYANTGGCLKGAKISHLDSRPSFSQERPRKVAAYA